jgi:riboflavin synthase
MFTGLIEDVGRVLDVQPTPGGQRLTIASRLSGDLAPGDSVATNGVCLTAVTVSSTAWTADVSPETLRVTSLGTLVPDRRVNLERPLAVGSRLGGHFVQGHVDGIGRVELIEDEGGFRRVRISYPPPLAAYFIEKGSVAVDGISLTIAALHDGWFDVQIVPHTWSHTNLAEAAPGTVVNLECDMIGKYVVGSLRR